jgi:hypothetical protein
MKVILSEPVLAVDSVALDFVENILLAHEI